MRNLLFVLLFSALLGSCKGSTCDSKSCQGCCAPDGTCRTGFDSDACGAAGSGCFDCRGNGAVCTANHVCMASSGTGGGAGGGSGGGMGGGSGGGAGGGVFGVADQQLVSGSRLKALRFIGADGAQAPFGTVYWDSQLSIACNPSQMPYYFLSYYQTFTQLDVGTARCYPSLVAAGSLYGTTTTFADPSCTQPLWYGISSFYSYYFGRKSGASSPKGIFSAANVRYGMRPTDGGSPYVMQITRATLHSGGVYDKQEDGGCVHMPDAGVLDWYTPGADVPDTEFVEMNLAIDP